MTIQELTELVAPWQSLYNDSTVLPIATTGAHLLAMLFGGGFAVAADRATLRVVRQGPERRMAQLDELRTVHRPVLIALAAAALTGIAMTAADIEEFIESPAFWVKLAFVVLLLINGLRFVQTESSLRKATPETPLPRYERLWRRMRLNAVLSIALWSATLVAGVVLVNVA